MKKLWQRMATWWKARSIKNNVQFFPRDVKTLEDVKAFIRETYDRPKFWRQYFSWWRDVVDSWDEVACSLFFAIVTVVGGLISVIALGVTGGDYIVWSFFSVWIAIHCIVPWYFWRKAFREWRDGFAEEFSKLPVKLSEAVHVRIRRVKDTILKDRNSLVEIRRRELNVLRSTLNEKKGYFATRKRDGFQAADEVLDVIQTSLDELDEYKKSLDRKEALLAQAFGACEARVPLVTGTLKDQVELELVRGLTGQVKVLGARIAKIEHDAMVRISNEFSGLTNVLSCTVERSLSLPSPEITGDDIRDVMRQLVESEQHLEQALHEVVDPLKTEMA